MGLNETLNSTNSTNSLNTSLSNQNNNSTDDDDLTNLTWLQDHNLLQNMTNNTDESTSSNNSTNDFHKKKEDNENVSPTKFRALTEKDDIKEIDLENNTIITSSGTTLQCSVPPVKYNPLLHTHTKPPYSFSSLIFMAIESSPNKALPVKEIYNWITKNYPYYEKAPDGWKNTVRHNLSLNKCFQKIEKGSKLLKDASNDDKSLNDQCLSKGSLWCIDQNLRPNLLQSIKKTPAQGFIYPYMSTAKAGTNLVQISNVINDNQLNGNINQINNIKNVTISNNSTLPSNNLIKQLPKKIIAIEGLPQQNNVLTSGKRVLIPIVSKVAREAEEDAAESMLTLTQCSTTGVLNNGNIYIITNNKGDNLLPLQLNSKPVIATTIAKPQQQTVNKNQIILTQPIITTTPTGTSQPTIIQPTVTTIQSDKQKQQSITTNNSTISTPTKLTTVNTTQLTTDHNYFNRGASSLKKVITIPASTATAIPLTLANGQKILLNKQLISANNIATTGLTSTANFIPIKNNLINSNNKNINKIITITTSPTTIAKNIIIKSPIKIQQPQQATITIEKKITNDKKRKIDTNDEDGLIKMGAEALYSLATFNSKKANDDQSKETSEKASEAKLPEVKSNEAKSSEAKSSEAKSSETKSPESKSTETKKSETKSTTPTKKTITIQTISIPTSTLTRSAAKKLKSTV